MPPLVSDDEASSEAETPYKKTASKDEEIAEDEPAGSGDEEGEGEEEYVVEKIMSHAWDHNDNVMKYEVKWLGYEKKSDRTWEPEDNLATAQEALDEYFSKIGGRPEKPKPKEKKRKVSEGPTSTPASAKGTGKGRKKAKTEDAEDSGTPTSTTNGRRKAKEKWEPPKGSWENEVLCIDTVEERPNPRTGDKEKFVYVMWNNKKKTLHAAKVIHQKCPQKLIQYYEQHLVFKNGPDVPMNGDDS